MASREVGKTDGMPLATNAGRAALLLVTAVVIGMFIYKANYTGTSYDESMTFRDYCGSVHQARHNYTSTNNHVLNSILIYFSHRWFGGYEQFIRVFPMVSGVLFFISTAYLLTRLVRSPWLAVFGLVTIVCVRMVFNYLLMARGYTFGLSAMTMYLAVVCYFMAHPLAFRHAWVPIVLLSLLNFLALGAMISSVFVMAAMNAVFVLAICPLLYRGAVRKIKICAVHGVSMAALSGGLLLWLYRPILRDVLHASENPYVVTIAQSWKGWTSFAPFMNELLNHRMYDPQGPLRGLVIVFYVLWSVFLVHVGYSVFQACRKGQAADGVRRQRDGVFVTGVLAVYLTVLFFYSVVLKRSPGLPRNQLFLIPLLLLCFVSLADRAISRIQQKRVQSLLLALLCVFLSLTAGQQRPSLTAVFDDGMCMARPTLKRLRALDPEHVWNIGFSPDMRYHYMGFLYYKQFDYKFNVNTGPQSNVLICRPGEQPAGGLMLDYDYFLMSNNCGVVLLKKPGSAEIIVEARPRLER